MMTDYPDGMTLRPMVSWPQAETGYRERSPFSAPWSATIDLLDRELHSLGRARRNAPSVLQIALREQDFRIDGMPRANAVPSHPGVILNVESAKGPLSFPCDKFDRWQHNLRAIALGLEALRKIDRYGITPGDEQYRGWLAIDSAPSMTAAAAERFLREFAGHRVDEVPTMANVFRRARAKAHPDRNYGDQTLWDQVAQAAAVLGLGA